MAAKYCSKCGVRVTMSRLCVPCTLEHLDELNGRSNFPDSDEELERYSFDRTEARAINKENGLC